MDEKTEKSINDLIYSISNYEDFFKDEYKEDDIFKEDVANFGSEILDYIKEQLINIKSSLLPEAVGVEYATLEEDFGNICIEDDGYYDEDEHYDDYEDYDYDSHDHINKNVEKLEELTLLDYQVPHVEKLEYILENSYYAVDNSKMGAGKTRTAAFLSKKKKFNKTLVVSPAMLLNTWEEMEIMADLSIATLGSNIHGIISYDMLRGRNNGIVAHGLIERIQTEKTVIGKGKKIKIEKEVTFVTTKLFDRLVEEGLFIIFDEYHKIKNTSSALHHCVKAMVLRFKEITEGNNYNSKILFLSGSPFIKEEETLNFCRVVGIINSKDLYTNKFGKFSFKEKNASGALELIDFCLSLDKVKTEKILDEHPLIPPVKLIKDALFQLYINIIVPNFTSIMTPVIDVPLDVKNGFYKLSPERIPLLQSAIKELKGAVDEIQGGHNKSAMAMLTRSLVLIDYQKIEAFVRNAIYTLETHPTSKVTLIFNYNECIDIASKLLQKYKPMILRGKVSKKERTKIIKEFNRPNLDHRLIIGNLTVCSLGIDLHDTDGGFPRYAFIAGSYNAINSHQVVYRFYRAGTKSIPHIRFVYIEGKGNSEVRILDSYSRKGKVMKLTLPGQAKAGIKFPGDFEKEIESNQNINFNNLSYPLKSLGKETTFADQPDVTQMLEELGIDDEDNEDDPADHISIMTLEDIWNLSILQTIKKLKEYGLYEEGSENDENGEVYLKAVLSDALNDNGILSPLDRDFVLSDDFNIIIEMDINEAKQYIADNSY